MATMNINFDSINTLKKGKQKTCKESKQQTYNDVIALVGHIFNITDGRTSSP